MNGKIVGLMRIATQQLLEKIVKERTLQELTMEYSKNVVTMSLMFLWLLR